MHYPLVVTWERGKELAQRLAPICRQHGWALRQVRALDECLSALRSAGPVVLAIDLGDLGNDRGPELEAFEAIAQHGRDVDVIAVLRAMDPELAHLCWDLGAGYVVEREQVTDQLGPLVAGLIKRNWRSNEAGTHGPAMASGG